MIWVWPLDELAFLLFRNISQERLPSLASRLKHFCFVMFRLVYCSVLYCFVIFCLFSILFCFALLTNVLQQTIYNNCFRIRSFKKQAYGLSVQRNLQKLVAVWYRDRTFPCLCQKLFYNERCLVWHLDWKSSHLQYELQQILQ